MNEQRAKAFVVRAATKQNWQSRTRNAQRVRNELEKMNVVMSGYIGISEKDEQAKREALTLTADAFNKAGRIARFAKDILPAFDNTWQKWRRVSVLYSGAHNDLKRGAYDSARQKVRAAKREMQSLFWPE